MKKIEGNKRNLGEFKNVVFQFTGAANIQILQLPTNFVEGSKNDMTDQVSLVHRWATLLGKGEALNLDKLLWYCKTDKATFNISDVITINTFKSYARHTLKACASGQGVCRKDENGTSCFFIVYRQKWDGRIMGAWLPYDESSKKLLAVKVESAESAEKKAEEKRRKMYEKLAKEFAK